MIDIVKDYTAISLGSAQATNARIVSTARSGAQFLMSGGRGSAPEDVGDAGPSLIQNLANSPMRLIVHVRGTVDRAVGRLGLMSETEVRALRNQVQRLERHISDLRGDR